MDPPISLIAGALALLVMMAFLLRDRRQTRRPGSAPPAESGDPKRRDRALTELQSRLERLKARRDSVGEEVDNDPRRAARAVRQILKQNPKR